LFESASRLGGVVRTQRIDGWLVESGPISLQESTPEIRAMVAELGLGKERIEAAPAAENRYLARASGLKAVPSPSSVASFLSTPLLSVRSKLAVARESARSPVARNQDISVAELVRDHFGREILETFVQPLVGGIYAGDTERLSARYAFPKIWEAEKMFGSLVRAASESSKRRKELGLPSPAPLISFRSGLQALTDALAEKLPAGTISLESDVRSLRSGSGARWSVQWQGVKGEASAEFDCVVAALPAWSLARLQIGDAGQHPLSSVGAIEYSPVSTVSLGFERGRVRHPLDGFGALVPASENRTLLGVVFASSLFPGRAPAGHVAMTAFAGGALKPEIARMADDQLIERVCGDLRELVGAEGKPAFARRTSWPRAIPQYNLGYGRHLEAMAECERSHPGFYIGGNIKDGISLPDCILSGTSLAKRAS
jgi:oxygen-dependent protoporphyrinogen oxidase